MEKNISHRDIKPDNILLVNNVYKLGDFGIAMKFTLENTLSKSNLSLLGINFSLIKLLFFFFFFFFFFF